MITILMDYGHSKVDPVNGKLSPDKTFYEWEFNRKLGKMITAELKTYGLNVIEIVSESEDEVKVTPSQRASRANDLCAKYGTANCMYVSIHANAAGNGNWMSARGWSIYVSKNSSQGSRNLANDIFDAVADEGFKMRQPMPSQKYWMENFTVIYKSKCKAVLTENLFYDNKEDLALLKDEETIKKLCRAHVKGILKFVGITYNECKCTCECCKNGHIK